MFGVPYGPQFQKMFSNIGAAAQPAQAGNGTGVGAHATLANTYGSYVQLLGGASLTDDCYAIEINIMNGALNAAVRAYIVEIAVDPNNGSSYTPYIPDLLVGPVGIYRPGQGNGTGGGGASFFFPMFFKAGTQIGARCSGAVAATGVGVEIRLWGAPKYPHLARAGTFCKVFNPAAGAGSVGGTAVPPGTTSEGSWVDVAGANTVDPLWWWQLGLSVGSSGMTDEAYFHYDVGIGDASNKHVVLDAIRFSHCGNERQTKYPHPFMGHYEAPAGVRPYVRGQGSATGDANMQAKVYGVGG
jgi:hypothetical protein